MCMLLLVLHVLSEFLTSLGAEATKRLPSMQLGKLVFAEVGKPGRELAMLDDDSGVEQVVGVAELRGVSGSMQTRLLSYQKSIVRPAWFQWAYSGQRSRTGPARYFGLSTHAS